MWTRIAFSPNPRGPKNATATVALLRKPDGETVGMIWHYTCHPTAVVPTDGISSDYPGAVRLGLREGLGEVPCLFAQGLSRNHLAKINTSMQNIDTRRVPQKKVSRVPVVKVVPADAVGEWQP